jgi:hypothetical protein
VVADLPSGAKSFEVFSGHACDWFTRYVAA